MATFVIGGYPAGSVLASGGGSPAVGSGIMLDPAFAAATSALTFTITDDDTAFSGSAAGPLDAGQSAVVTDALGGVIASGPVRLGLASSFTQPGGGAVTITEVWVGQALTGYVATAQLVPGIGVTITAQTDTGAAGPQYSTFVTPNYAPAANTSFTGGTGADRIEAGSGNDSVVANAGNDLVFGGDGNDFASGGDGDDSLSGGSGNDSLYGGTGNDTLSGGSGNDSLFGDSGNDTFRLIESEAADSVFGGAGTDTMDVSATPGRGVNVTFTGAGSGNYNFSGLPTAGSFSLIEGVIGSDFADTINGASDASAGLRLASGAGNDSVTGGSGADTILGGSGNDQLTGGAGNDLFVLADGDGADIIAGGTGSGDRIDASAATAPLDITFTGTGNGTYTASGLSGSFTGIDAVTAGAGNDTATGSAAAEWVDGAGGNDRLSGGGGADTLLGGAGNDTITGGAGADSLSGGDGDDRFVILGGDGGDTIAGGAGTDILDGSGLTAGVSLAFSGAGAGSLTGAAGSFTFSQTEQVLLGAGNDTVTGSAGTEVVDAGDGADSVTGGGGADSLSGGAGADTLEGGDGDDTLRGGAGADSLSGGTGLDFADYSDSTAAVRVDLTSGTGQGGFAQGDQYLGIDAIIGSAFDDTLIGFDGESLSGSDIFFNVLFGGDGNDLIDGRGDSDLLDGGTGNDTVLGGAGRDTLTGGDGDDRLSGGDGADTLGGGSGADLLEGGSGADSLGGGAGNDSLSGGDGADSLSGGEGDDLLLGGSGPDTLTGGAGRDVFALAASGGASVITDFQTGLDRLDVTGLVDAAGQPVDWADVTISDDGNGNALLAFPGGETVLLAGVSPQGLTGQAGLYMIGVPCFAGGSLILTPEGERPVEAIRRGDLVMTRDDGPQPVLWTGCRHLDAAALDLRPDLRPVLIRAGAFGPHGDLFVSPQHAILVDTAEGERLARARHLAELGDRRFRVAKGKRQVSYHHLLTPRHALLRSGGVWSESLYPGPMALSALGVAACLDLARSVPHLAPVLAGRISAEAVYGPTVRPVAKRRRLTLMPAGGRVTA